MVGHNLAILGLVELSGELAASSQASNFGGEAEGTGGVGRASNLAMRNSVDVDPDDGIVSTASRTRMLSSSLLGASGLAAISVLISVYLAAPTDNPIGFALASAVLGGAVGPVFIHRIRRRKPLAMLLLFVWGGQWLCWPASS